MPRILITGPSFRQNLRLLHTIRAVPHDGRHICAVDWGAEPENDEDALWLVLDDNGAEDVFRPEQYALLDSATVENRWKEILEYCGLPAEDGTILAVNFLWKQEQPT